VGIRGVVNIWADCKDETEFHDAVPRDTHDNALRLHVVAGLRGCFGCSDGCLGRRSRQRSRYRGWRSRQGEVVLSQDGC
jgi:hypothetical protein